LSDIEFIYQGFLDNDHAVSLNDLLLHDNIERVIFNVAFVKTSGIYLLYDGLKQIKKRGTIFAGVRNNITSIQAVFKLIDIGVNLYLVDTGSSNVIFHPKLYAFEFNNCYKIIIGSANLTSGGLNSNIELSTLLSFDKPDLYINNFIKELISMPEKLKKNIFKINNKKEAFLLFKRGLLIDERITHNNISGEKNKLSKKNDDTPRIKLQNKYISIPKVKIKRRVKPSGTLIIPSFKDWILVWESKELKERDLNIPSGKGTNPTGSMLFNKGNFEDIDDQRTYFRNNVFNDLDWVQDDNPRTAHYERSIASFHFLIRGLYYGIYELKLSHNTDTNSKSFHQSNSMTQIHWGEQAKKFIADSNLLGEIMELYKSNFTPPQFLIKID
jgi:HKD family nuclease